MSDNQESLEEALSLLISTLVRKEQEVDKHLTEIKKEIAELKESADKSDVVGMWVTRKLLAEAMQDYTDWSVDRVAKRLGLM